MFGSMHDLFSGAQRAFNNFFQGAAGQAAPNAGANAAPQAAAQQANGAAPNQPNVPAAEPDLDLQQKIDAIGQKYFKKVEGQSLEAALTALMNDTKFFQEKAGLAVIETRKVEAKMKTLDDLLQQVSTLTDANGSFDCTNDNATKELIQKARGLGVQIPANKTVFNRDERANLIRNIEIVRGRFDMDMKRFVKMAEESSKLYNQLFQELLAMYNKHRDIIRKITQLIKANAAA